MNLIKVDKELSQSMMYSLQYWQVFFLIKPLDAFEFLEYKMAAIKWK